MLKANILVNSFGYVARREYVYCIDIATDRVKRCRMTNEEKESVRLYEKDAYNEAKTWEFLNSIWKNHDPIFGGDGFMPGRQRDYFGR